MISESKIAAERRPLHALNRLGLGPRPGDVERVKVIGVEAYVHEQLHPTTIPERADLVRRIDSLTTLRMTPVELFMRYQVPIMRARGDLKARKRARLRSRIVLEQAIEARLMRALYGPRHLQEVMAAFWFNHFNVFRAKGLDHLWIGAYEQEAIRPHTLGRFEDLLLATARHPAMLFYLDNWLNTGPDSPGRRGPFEGINENYAREVMELHTLGVNGGYTQQDVISLAHLLTGWGFVRRPPRMRRFGRGRTAPFEFISPPNATGFYFDPRRHDFSPQTVVGHYFASGGIEQGENALKMLARHPSTAHHLSLELAQYFVADNPPPALVARMASRYLATAGDIRGVLETLLLSNEFWDPANYGNKFKTPYEYVISAVRAAGTNVTNWRPMFGWMQMLGQPLFGCETPNGYANSEEAWLNPDAMMMRINFATALGAGRMPLERPPFDDSGTEARAADHDRERPTAAPEPAQLASTLGDYFSSNSADAVEKAPPALRAALLLGSPEFMMR